MQASIVAPLLRGKSVGSSDSDFVVAEWQDAGGVSGKPRLIAPLHVHHKDDEAWYVLQGVLCVQVGDQVVEVRAGAAVTAPRGTRHTYWNPGPDQARYLLVMTGRIYGLIQAIHKMPERSPAALETVFREYESEFLGWQ
jgi:mannose-6-phosphate isomerase-like protein (cupin superfamily)